MWGVDKVLGLLKAGAAFLNKWMVNADRAEDKASGARKAKLAQQQAHEEAEDHARDIWNRDDPGRIDLDGRVRRSDADGPGQD
jgi:hypothetical protein